MDWTGPNKKKLRKVLVTIYNTPTKLARFVSDELDLNLNLISNEAGLEDRAFNLIEEGCAEGAWINLLYEKLCEENVGHPAIVRLRTEIEKPLIEKSTKLAEADWQALFSEFSSQDFAYVQIAFLQAFKAVVHENGFWDIRPDCPNLSQLGQVQALLQTYDRPDLAVRFVEFVIAEFQRLDEGQNRDLSALEQWRDRSAQAHNVTLQQPEPPAPNTRQGYLLVSLQPSGRQTQKQGAFVNLFAELQVTGEPTPIEFGACSLTCSFDEVADHLSGLIRKAEMALISYECSEMVVELFLPCKHLEENVATWQVKNEQDRLRDLGKYRRFLVRSFERAVNPAKRVTVSQKWQLLQTCVTANTGFHCQKICPKPGDLEALLSDKPGLRLLAALPDDPEQRTEIFYDIINSAVPIALWCSQVDGCSVADLEAQFDQLLGKVQLTDFFQLAQQWRRRQVEADHGVIKPIRLLCDCPDRWPSLPDPMQEDDLLVTS